MAPPPLVQVEYEKADPELHTELFCKYPYRPQL